MVESVCSDVDSKQRVFCTAVVLGEQALYDIVIVVVIPQNSKYRLVLLTGNF